VPLPSFLPDLDHELIAPFWQAFQRRAIALPRCSVCHRFEWYPDDTGPDCTGAHYEWVDVATTGVVHSVVRVHRAFLPDGGGDVPFLVGLVEIDGTHGLRLASNFADDAEVRIGDRVEASFVDVGGNLRPVFRVIER
jgi:uncharacterized OB-fold protein